MVTRANLNNFLLKFGLVQSNISNILLSSTKRLNQRFYLGRGKKGAWERVNHWTTCWQNILTKNKGTSEWSWYFFLGAPWFSSLYRFIAPKLGMFLKKIKQTLLGQGTVLIMICPIITSVSLPHRERPVTVTALQWPTLPNAPYRYMALLALPNISIFLWKSKKVTQVMLGNVERRCVMLAQKPVKVSSRWPKWDIIIINTVLFYGISIFIQSKNLIKICSNVCFF